MKKLTIVYLIANLIFLAAAAAFIHQYTDKNHLCSWDECPINDLGWKVQKEPVTDSECYVHCHFMHPEWEYETIERWVFSSPATIK